MADLVDSGELEVELNFDPSADPPIDDPFEPVTITFGSGTTWEFSGALMNYGGEAPLADRVHHSRRTKTCARRPGRFWSVAVAGVCSKLRVFASAYSTARSCGRVNPIESGTANSPR